MKPNISTHLRIIWTIATKDIIGSLKNLTFLGIVIGVGLLMLGSQALSFLTRANSKPRAYYFDPGKSIIIREIVRHRELDFFPAESFQDMMHIVGSSATPVLGLVIPANFDQDINNNSPVIIEGYRIHWANPTEISSIKNYFEDVLSTKVGVPIQIFLIDENVHPASDGIGFTSMIRIGFVMGVMTIGLILVPLLITEEKENHTFDVLIISPAKISHILAGKAIAGMFYSLVAAVFMFLFTAHWIVHWGIAILAVLFGALCTVSIGLLLGSIFDNPIQINMWAGIFIVLFLFPVLLWPSFQIKLNTSLVYLIQVIPSFTMSKLIGVSFTKNITFNDLWGNLAASVTFIIVTLGLVYRQIIKMDK